MSSSTIRANPAFYHQVQEWNTSTSFTKNATTIEPPPNVPRLHFLRNTTNTELPEIYVGGLVQSLLTLFLNVVLFTYIILRPKLRKKKSNMFFLNLQLVHILLSITGIIIIFYTSSRAEVILNNGFLIEMFFALMISTMDRYVAISYPYKYEKFTTRSALSIMIGSWLVPVLFVTLSFIFDATQWQLTIISTIAIAMAIVTLAGSNLRIFMIARRHAREISGTKGLQKLKSTYVCFAIVFSFALLWTPYFVHNIMILTHAYIPSSDSAFTEGVVQTALMNSLLDPILFVAFRRDVKKAIKGSLRINVKKRSDSNEATMNTRTTSM